MVTRYARRPRTAGAVTRPLESAVQKAVFDWVKTKRVFIAKHDFIKFEGDTISYDVFRALSDFVFAIPNGQMLAGNAAQRARYMEAMKKRGFKNGVADIFVALPRGKYNGLWIELKRDTKARATDDQRAFLSNMRSVGYMAVVCCGGEETIKQIQEYLAL